MPPIPCEYLKNFSEIIPDHLLKIYLNMSREELTVYGPRSELNRIAEKTNLPRPTIRRYWEDFVEYQEAGQPYGNNAQGLKQWQKQKYLKVFEEYIDESL